MIKDQLLLECEKRMKVAIESTQHEFNTIRSGRASATLLDRIYIDYYGTKTQLKHIANISTPEPRTIVVSPYETKFIKEIEKQILSSDLGLNPGNDGKVIRLSIPQLNEERRHELVKLVKKLAEDGRVSIRNIRRDSNEELKKLENSKEITKDDLEEYHKKTQELTDKYIEKINESLALKEKEIMEV
ncbi:MAG: ribosome recycling factor [Actinobacteria bacterium]|nr:ribosome recycling factor [Actinomycetota bacterium]